MAKALNQNFFTAILYGGENAADILRLESTTNATKGIVQAVGTTFDLIISGQIGRFVHANTATRTYTYPDYSGTVLVSGIFTATNQLIYSSAVGVAAVLNSTNNSVLKTSATGVPTWITGSEGYMLQIIGGQPTFASMPATIGEIDVGADNDLARYATGGPDNHLTSLPTISARALLSPGGVPSWSLVTATYLAASGMVPLGTGTSGQKLKSNGDGTFFWANDFSDVQPGVQFRLPYYVNSSGSQVLDDSTFLEVDETTKTLSFLNNGRTRYYEATVNGTGYVELRGPIAMGSPVIFTLPAADGVSGAFLTTDGLGNLSFIAVDNGSVANALANQLAYYASAGNDVVGLPTTAARALLSPGGVLTWALITAPYLSALGGSPLGNGTLNQVLVSNADGTFNWVTASSLVGQVNNGPINAAAYYAATGTAVSPSGFVDFIDGTRKLVLKNNGAVQFMESTGGGSNYVELLAPTTVAADVSFRLPGADGTFEQALVTDGTGNLSFITVGRGVVQTGVADSLAYYPASSNEVNDFPNVASRVMLTTALNVISWSLLTEGYLQTTGGGPLSGGLTGQVLVSDGSGNFVWVFASSLVGSVQNGNANYVAFYPASGTSVNDSQFLFVNDPGHELHLQSAGILRFYDASNYVALRAPTLSSDITFRLPAADATLPGQVLISDAGGNLSFVDQVDPGTVNALAFYQASTRRVSPTTSVNYVGTGFDFVTGPLFEFVGQDGALPVALNFYSGNGTSGNTGADMILRAGASDTGTYGSLFLGIGTANWVRLSNDNPGTHLSLLDDVALRFYDADGSNYVGFKAPTAVSSDVVWNLPVSDGTANQVLSTDGLGQLAWVSAVVGITVNTGVTNAIAFYSSPSVVDNSQLLVPVGLPAGNAYALISDTLGQLSYQLLVETLGTAGQLAYYTAGQTVGHSAVFFVDEAGKNFDLLNQGSIRFFELTTNGLNYVSFLAPASLTGSYSLTLPALQPSDDQALVAATSSTLEFKHIDRQTTRQQRGTTSVGSGVSEVSVIFEVPFTDPPGHIKTQWSIEGAGLSTLPTHGVLLKSEDGFTLKLSTTTTQNYSLYWEAYAASFDSPTLSAYLFGADDGGTLSADVYALALDTDTLTIVSVATMSSLRAYTAATSSTQYGYCLGGQVGLVSSSTIASFEFATNTAATIVSTLPALRSGAAGVGNRDFGYVAGGENIGVGSLTSIARIDHATEITSTLVAVLTATNIKRGHTQNKTTGIIVHDTATSTVDKLSFASETVSLGTAIGFSNVQVGCTFASSNYAYFGRNTGAIYRYDIGSDTVTATGTTVSSVTGLSAAFNSFSNGYFGGALNLDRFSFATETAANINTLPYTAAAGASISTVQTNGVY